MVQTKRIIPSCSPCHNHWFIVAPPKASASFLLLLYPPIALLTCKHAFPCLDYDQMMNNYNWYAQREHDSGWATKPITQSTRGLSGDAQVPWSPLNSSLNCSIMPFPPKMYQLRNSFHKVISLSYFLYIDQGRRSCPGASWRNDKIDLRLQDTLSFFQFDDSYLQKSLVQGMYSNIQTLIFQSGIRRFWMWCCPFAEKLMCC